MCTNENSHMCKCLKTADHNWKGVKPDKPVFLNPCCSGIVIYCPFKSNAFQHDVLAQMTRSQLLSFRANRCWLSIQQSPPFSLSLDYDKIRCSALKSLQTFLQPFHQKQMYLSLKLFGLCWNSSTELSMVLTAWFWAESLRLETLVFNPSHPNCETSHSRRARVKRMIFCT